MDYINHSGNPIIVDLDFKFAKVSGIGPDDNVIELIKIWGHVLIKRNDETYVMKVLLQKELIDDNKGQQIHTHFESFIKECSEVSSRYEVDDFSIIYKFN